MKIERRFFQVRTDSQGDEAVIMGRAIGYGYLSSDLGGFRELTRPGAVTRYLRSGGDVKALFNHDPNQILGRCANGTLKLNERGDGLHFRCVVNREDPQAMSTYAKIKRGDISECSYGFMCNDDRWYDSLRDALADWDVDLPVHVPGEGDQPISISPADLIGGDEGDEPSKVGYGEFFSRFNCPIRCVRDMSLQDVSCVSFPAYAEGATSASARMREMFPFGTDFGFPDSVKNRIQCLTHESQLEKAQRILFASILDPSYMTDQAINRMLLRAYAKDDPHGLWKPNRNRH
jgi:HK97 family phage prohead protease